MLNKILLREENYWLIPISIISILLVGACLYAGVIQIRLVTGLIGFAGLWFTYYIIRRGYDNKHAGVHILICLVLAVLGAYGLFLLTN